MNSVANEPNYSQDTLAAPEQPDFPYSLDDYKSLINDVEIGLEIYLYSQNTYDLLDAASIIADGQEIYEDLIKRYLAGQLPLTQDELPEAPEDEFLSQVDTHKKLIRYLGRTLPNHANKLRARQSSLKEEVLSEIAAIEARLSENQARLTDWQNNYPELLTDDPDFSTQADRSPSTFRIQQVYDPGDLDRLQSGFVRMNDFTFSNARVGLTRAQSQLSRINGQLQTVETRIAQLKTIKQQRNLSQTEKAEWQSLNTRQNQLKQSKQQYQKAEKEAQRVIDRTIQDAKQIDKNRQRCSPCGSQKQPPKPGQTYPTAKTGEYPSNLDSKVVTQVPNLNGKSLSQAHRLILKA